MYDPWAKRVSDALKAAGLPAPVEGELNTDAWEKIASGIEKLVEVAKASKIVHQQLVAWVEEFRPWG